MRLAATATAVSCLAIAAFAQSAVSLTALLLIGGLANALGGPSVSALLEREVAVHRHGLAFGAQNSGASLGRCSPGWRCRWWRSRSAGAGRSCSWQGRP
jgi:hypothetical protein